MKMKIWKAIVLILLINYLYFSLAFNIDIPGVFITPIHIVSGYIAYLGATSIPGIKIIDRFKLIGLLIILSLTFVLSFGLPHMFNYVRILSSLIFLVSGLAMLKHQHNEIIKDSMKS
ncbi:hypothetical protein NNC19_17920 [Clostridium sp. SHJSY1]|uniref:hypothetical protein n=1 Tax=Clostridium sp. SHJSY1 TaxID=2942483 RepID=UPI002874218E|nr:hypothetical protein [Clostridium sp. SHJSY1]MDS0527572.1 hypothetical protein [Clostridium sp. SHJSY1]